MLSLCYSVFTQCKPPLLSPGNAFATSADRIIKSPLHPISTPGFYWEVDKTHIIIMQFNYILLYPYCQWYFSIFWQHSKRWFSRHLGLSSGCIFGYFCASEDTYRNYRSDNLSAFLYGIDSRNIRLCRCGWILNGADSLYDCTLLSPFTFRTCPLSQGNPYSLIWNVTL